MSWSTRVLAKTGLTKRGVPTIPSCKVPPRTGVSVECERLMSWMMTAPLKESRKTLLGDNSVRSGGILYVVKQSDSRDSALQEISYLG